MKKIYITEIETCTWDYSEGAGQCQHDGGYRVEAVEVDTMRNGEHDTYEVNVAICIDPDCDEELEDVNPDEDRAEALADMQIMEALGK